MKRWLDRGFDPDQDGREKAPVEPVRVEPLEIGRERSSYAWPALIALFVVFALGAAMLNHFTSEPATPTPTPPGADADRLGRHYRRPGGIRRTG